MSREAHVRICERLRGKFPLSTRLYGRSLRGSDFLDSFNKAGIIKSQKTL